ncbi:MAG TPA: SGNH/GDSL hydrolase family protein [Candidatus Saccharimonadia bacterium]
MVPDEPPSAVDGWFCYATNMRIILVFIGLFIVVLLLVLLVEVWLAMRNRPPAYRNVSPNAEFGQSGPVMHYVVMGDSTAAGEGAPYEAGIAVGSARYLAAQYQVKLTNVGVSGAKTADVEGDQLAQAAALKPDLVLISVGANDVVGRRSPQAVEAGLRRITDRLVAANCKVKIVLTGSPNMGTITRFAQPLRTVAGLQTHHLNSRLYPWITASGYTLAPIARDTTAAFRDDPSLFGSDRFHPNARGYAVWLKTINPALNQALADQLSHCKE